MRRLLLLFSILVYLYLCEREDIWVGWKEGKKVRLPLGLVIKEGGA